MGTKGVGKNFSSGGAGTTKKKRPKKSKKDRKTALLSLFQGGREGATEKKDRKIPKRAKYSTIKPLSTISVPCMKIQGEGGARPPLPTPMTKTPFQGECNPALPSASH